MGSWLYALTILSEAVRVHIPPSVQSAGVNVLEKIHETRGDAVEKLCVTEILTL